jgi:hypothetical protein
VVPWELRVGEAVDKVVDADGGQPRWSGTLAQSRHTLRELSNSIRQ